MGTGMNVLIIGGTGLISTSITKQLVQQGHAVTLFNRGRTPNRATDSVTLIQGDRKDYAAFETLFADKRYDVVVDMVAFHPDDTESAIRAFDGRCGQFIHCSTVCVYSGPVTQIPTPETEPYHSIGGYGRNKIACEKKLLDAFADRKFPCTIMRPSHSFGEGGDIIRPFGPNNTFVDRLRKGKPIIVMGDGNNVWASAHVDDVGAGFVATMGNAKCLGQAYNIASDEYMTWNTYHEQVADVVGGTYRPVHIPTATLREVAPTWSGGTYEIFAWPSAFDNSKIKRDTAYKGQTINFREGVRRAVAWLEENGRLVAADTDTYEDSLIVAWDRQMARWPRLEPATA